MSANQEIDNVREALAAYFSGLSDYLAGASTQEPSLDTLRQAIIVDEALTVASNRVTGYAGYSSGALSEAVDRVSSILKEINLVQAPSSTIYGAMLSDVEGDSANWQAFLYRTLNYLEKKDPSQ